MSSLSPLTEFCDINAENVTVSELISFLRSAFLPMDFLKVEQILTVREEAMKKEVAYWKEKYETMAKKHGELASTKLDIEDKQTKYKRECDLLQEQIKQLEEDKTVQFGRCKRAEARYLKLLEELRSAETANRKLILENSDLASAKCKAEGKVEIYMKRFEELGLRVRRLEEDVGSVVTSSPPVQKRTENGMASKQRISEGMPGVKKRVKSEPGSGDGTVSENLAKPAAKQIQSNCDNKGQSLAGPDYGNDTPEVRSNQLQGSGPHSVIMTCNAKPMKKYVVAERGSSDKVMNTPVAVADGRTESRVVIEIDDSDIEVFAKGETSVPNVIASGVIFSDKETESSQKSSHHCQTGEENGRRCSENCLLFSSTKRKRDSCNSSDVEKVIATLRRRKDEKKAGESKVDLALAFHSNPKRAWESEVEMILAFTQDLELCMNAVCALYRQQMHNLKSTSGSSVSPLIVNQGLAESDALRDLNIETKNNLWCVIYQDC